MVDGIIYISVGATFIFSDFDIEALKCDPGGEPGVFLSAKKPKEFIEKNMKDYRLYSIVLGRRSSVARNSIYWALIFLPLCKILGKRRWINMLKNS